MFLFSFHKGQSRRSEPSFPIPPINQHFKLTQLITVFK